MPTRTKPSTVSGAVAKKRPSKKPVEAAQTAARKGPKTTATKTPLAAFLATLDAATRADCERLDAWMKAATGAEAVMYGKAIVGYGSTTIRYADGREAPWMKLGFAPRKRALVLYGALAGASAALLDRLGKHDTGKDCLYVKRLSDVDGAVLQRIISAAARA
jgi:Domain of unknown function (DU1801)